MGQREELLDLFGLREVKSRKRDVAPHTCSDNILIMECPDDKILTVEYSCIRAGGKNSTCFRQGLWCCAEVVNPRCSHHPNKAGHRSPPPPLWFSQR
ncbi:hypothetical protein PAMP_000854 [Pampus punctatissimus]